MISKEEIKKLADLARIEIPDDEMEKLGGEMDAILGYIGQIKSITTERDADFLSPEQGKGERSEGGVNIMREDINPTDPETYSKELIAEFPDKANNYLKVKKIL